MADSDITVTFVDGPSQDNSQNDATQSGGVSALGDGLHATKESKEELYERLLNDMTDTMLDIFNVLSGKGSAGSFVDEIRSTAAAILESTESATGKAGDTTSNKKSFTKATKVEGLKPTDINIVDKQWILGSLLINSTLLRMETLMKGFMTSSKTSKSEDKDKKSEKGESTEYGNIKKFLEATKDFKQINDLAKVIIPLFMKNMKIVNWDLVFNFFKNFKKAFTYVIDISDELEDRKEAIENFGKRSKEIISGLLKMTLGLALLGILVPLILIGTVGAYAMTLAIKPLLYIVDAIGDNKHVDKFESKSKTLYKGILSMLATVTLLTIMLPFLPFAIVSTLLLTVAALGMRLVLLALPSPVSVVKGALSAILLTVMFGALTLSVLMVHKAGTDLKKTLMGLAVIGSVALGGALIAIILGLGAGLIAMGAVSAVGLAVFFTALMVAVRVVARTGQYADAAIEALGHISRRSINGDDGTEHNDESGILGFFSKLASWPFVKALLISILTNSLLAISSLGLLIGATLLKYALKALTEISDDYFPIGVAFSETKPGAALVAISMFSKYISGKVDENGNPLTDGTPIIGFKTLLEIIPLTLFGVLMTLAAKTIKLGFEELNKIDENLINSVKGKVKGLGETLNIISSSFQRDSSGKGFVGWVVEKILNKDVSSAAEWLTACLPLFSLMLYGWLLTEAAVPLKEGIEAIGEIKTENVTASKMKAIGDAITGLLNPIKAFTGGFFDQSDRYGNIVMAISGLVSAFPNLINVIVSLSTMKVGELNTGLANFAYLLEQLFGTEDTRNYLNKMGEIASFGLYNSGKGSTKGSLLAALQSIKDNNVKVNTTMFDQISELMGHISPIADLVVKFATLDKDALARGIDGMKTIIDSTKEMTATLMGNSGNGDDAMSAINSVLSIMDTKASANLAQNNPLFAIIDLFQNMGDMTTFATNVEKFNTSLLSLSATMAAMDETKMSGFRSFREAITDSRLDSGIRAIGKLVAYKNDIDALAGSFDRLGEAIQKIADIDTNRITKVIEDTNASALSVIQAQRQADNTAQSTIINSAVDEYVRFISDMLASWNENGISIRQTTAPVPTVIPPRANIATTSGSWE